MYGNVYPTWKPARMAPPLRPPEPKIGQLKLSQTPPEKPSFIKTSLTGVILGGLTAALYSILTGEGKNALNNSVYGAAGGFIVGAIVPRLDL